MKDYQIFVGIDVSKEKLDVCAFTGLSPEDQKFLVIENKLSGFRKLLTWLKKLEGRAVVCLEHTGMYALPVCTFLSEKQIHYMLTPAIQIQKSIGIKRGKNDPADAAAIARYAYINRDRIKLYAMPQQVLMRLKLLHAYRERLLSVKKMLTVPANEMKLFVNNGMAKDIIKDSLSVARNIDEKIKQVELKILQAIQSDEHCHKYYQLLLSIPGIGPQAATQLLIVTQGFTAFDNARQLACYAGVAPFEYSSGRSIRGRTKVSHLANKKIKSMLHLSSIVAMRFDPQLKAYYQRKIKEGKNSMLVINAIRNKLLHRIFAVVQRGTPFVKLNQYAA
jgi:transposase